MVYLTTLEHKWLNEWFNVIVVCSLLMYSFNQQVEQQQQTTEARKHEIRCSKRFMGGRMAMRSKPETLWSHP